MGKFKTNIHKDGVTRQIDNSFLQEYLDTGWLIGKGFDVWNKGLTVDDDRVEKYVSKRRGKPLSEEHKKHLSEVNIGKKWTKEALEKRSISRRGKKLSEETKSKISRSLLGHKVTQQQIQKRNETVIKRYGSLRTLPPDFHFSDEQRVAISKRNSSAEFQQHQREVKMKNGTFNTSRPEQMSKQKLVNIFGNDDVIFYYSDDRYPFECDAYIKSKDLFIEFNYHWTHGTHPYDKNNLLDIERLNEIKNKAQTRINSKGKLSKSFYAIMIEVWTIRDVKKLQCANNNCLNYLMFYTEKEFDNWLDSLDVENGLN